MEKFDCLQSYVGVLLASKLPLYYSGNFPASDIHQRNFTGSQTLQLQPTGKGPFAKSQHTPERAPD